MKTHTFFSWRLMCALSIAVLLSGLYAPIHVRAQSAGITSPAPGSSVSGAVPIMGTAMIDPFQRYELYYKQEPSGDDSYIYFDGNTRQVQNGQIGLWQTSDLAPGTYTLRMRVVKTDGNYSEHFAPNLSVNQQPSAPAPEAEPEEELAPATDLNEGQEQGQGQEPEQNLGPTPTPIPIETPTPVAQPTPVVVQVEQPNLGDAPAPTPTPELVALGSNSQGTSGSSGNPPANLGSAQPSANPGTVGGAVSANFTSELGAALSLDQLRDRFVTGMRYSAGIFLLVLGIFVGKRLLERVLSRAG
jgi:hypothetical protein